MSFNEMTITLHDVQLILGISARGLTVEYSLSNKELANLIIQQTGLDRDSVEKYVKRYGIEANALKNAADIVKLSDTKVRCYFAYLPGSTLFLDTRGRILTHFWPCLEDICQFDGIG